MAEVVTSDWTDKCTAVCIYSEGIAADYWHMKWETFGTYHAYDKSPDAFYKSFRYKARNMNKDRFLMRVDDNGPRFGFWQV